MRRALAMVLLAALGLMAPTASASTLEDQMDEFHFGKVVFTITWNTDDDRANVIVSAEELQIVGEGASDLRHCIDGDDACPVAELKRAAVDSVTDGEVTSEEAESFALYLKVGLSTTDQVKEMRQNLKGLVKIDDQAATSTSFTELKIDAAEGEVTSQDAIELSVIVTGSYATVEPANEHRVWMQRTESNLTVADEIVVQGGKNWRIDEESIRPESVQNYYTRGKIEATQGELESPDPLVFTLEYHKRAPGWGLLGALSALFVAAWVGRKP